MRDKLKSVIDQITSIGSELQDSSEIRTQKSILVGACFLGITFGLFSAASEFNAGRTLSALITLVWAILTVLYLVDFRRSKNLGRFRFLVLATVLLMPFLGHLALGGYIFGSAGILWGFVSPLLAILTTDIREARRWFFGFLGLIAVAVFLDPLISPMGSVSEPEIIFQLVFTIVGVTTFVFIFATYLIRQKDTAYQLLDDERAKSENLLLNVLPEKIVPLLKRGEDPIAERFESASVIFADFVGSTPLTEVLEPAAVIDLLNQIFSQFDLMTERHGLEKIRTVGDNYMAAAGVPLQRDDHAHAVASAALEMKEYIHDLPSQHGTKIAFRFGISSGELIAGVIGKQKFHYDVWGDAVNVASRMESHGVPGKIQISRETYVLIETAFVCEKRGTVEVKGKGEMETWFLQGKSET